MKEARVKCTCPSYKLNDLGRFLTWGQSFTIQEDEAQRSNDLKRAEKIGAVTIRWAERCRAVKQPSNAPPYLRNLKKPIQVTPDPTPIQYIQVDDLREVLGALMEEFRNSLVEEIRGMVDEARLSGPSMPARQDTSAPRAIPEESSVFIPSNLVDKSRKVDLSAATTETESKGPDLEKTLGALRATKK